MTDTVELIAFCIWILSLVVGLSVIASFWRDEVSRLSGFYAIKPFVVEIICKSWLIPLIHNLGIIAPYRSKVLEFHALSRITNAILYSTVEIILAMLLACYFRNLYRSKASILWVLLFLDCFRWIVVNLASLVIFTNLPFDNYIYQIYVYDFVWYLAYSVLAVGLGIMRRNKLRIEAESTSIPV